MNNLKFCKFYLYKLRKIAIFFIFVTLNMCVKMKGVALCHYQ